MSENSNRNEVTGPSRAKKRKLGSMVSKVIPYFQEITESGDTPRKKTHLCTLCKEKVNATNESNMVSHMLSCHTEIYKQLAFDQEDHPIVQRLKTLQAIVEVVSLNGRPFSYLLDSGFQKLIRADLKRLEDAGYGINVSFRDFAEIKEHLASIAKKIREKIRVEVKDRPLSLMVDIVTKHGRSILGTSLQYSVNGVLKIRSIGMIELTASHTGKYLAETIIKRLKVYDIDLKQIFTITTDNGKNVLKMVRDIVIHLRSEIEIEKAKANTEQEGTDSNDNEKQYDFIVDADAQTNDAIESYLAQSKEITDEEAMDRVMEEVEVEAMLDNETLLNVMSTEMEMCGANFLFDITGINCAAHTLQLAIQSGLNNIQKCDDNVIRLTREVCLMLRLQSTINETDEMGIEYRLPRLENKTRWSSMYFMLSDVFNCKRVIEYFANVKKEKRHQLLLQKWEILQELIELLEIPYLVTNAFQHTKLTLSDVYGQWLGMELHLESLCTNVPLKTDLAHRLLEALKERNKNIFRNPFMGAAIYLDPRYQSEVLMHDDKRDQAKKVLLDIWRRILVLRNKSDSNNCTEASPRSETNSTKNNKFFFDQEDAILRRMQQNKAIRPNDTQQNNLHHVDIELIIDLFQPELLMPRNSVLEYWETHKEDQPELYEIASVLFSVPPTEVPIERDFSSLDFIFTKRRGRLSHQRLEDIMLIYLNEALFHEVNEDDVAVLKKKTNDPVENITPSKRVARKLNFNIKLN